TGIPEKPRHSVDPFFVILLLFAYYGTVPGPPLIFIVCPIRPATRLSEDRESEDRCDAPTLSITSRDGQKSTRGLQRWRARDNHHHHGFGVEATARVPDFDAGSSHPSFLELRVEL